MTEYGLILCLILIPLALRWITAWQIGRFRSVVVKEDEEYKKMAGELNEIRDAIFQVERQQARYAARRSNLHMQIENARAELAEMRLPAKGRMAA